MFETLTKGFRNARNKLSGVTELTADNIAPALRDVRLSLLEADVELGVTKAFLERVKEASVGQTVRTVNKQKGQKVDAASQFIKICQDELEAMMSSEAEPINFAPKPAITGIMMIGLQGSGKTTSAAKLARLLEREHGRKPLLVAADVARPGAIEQLQTLGESLDIPVFAIPGGQPPLICEQALERAKKLRRDTVIYDTAGRLAIDEALMGELQDIRQRVTPQTTYLVVDAMIGQDSVKTAKSFNERIGIDGVILTKLDGDARGGAALSVKEVTGAPISFVGMGETLDRLEEFRAEGMASRILGMGDVVGLIKDFEGVIDEERAEKDAKRMLQGQFTLDDFLEQIEMIQGMGPLQDIFEKLPFFADSVPDGFQVDDKELGRVRALVQSMTKKERADIELFRKQPSRLERVAKGAGRTKEEVAELLQRFAMMKNMMGGIGQQAGMLSKIPGMKQLAGAKKLKNMLSAGEGLEGNPMMANLAAELLEAAVAEGRGPAGPASSARSTRSKKELAKRKSKRKAQRKSRRKSRR